MSEEQQKLIYGNRIYQFHKHQIFENILDDLLITGLCKTNYQRFKLYDAQNFSKNELETSVFNSPRIIKLYFEE